MQSKLCYRGNAKWTIEDKEKNNNFALSSMHTVDDVVTMKCQSSNIYSNVQLIIKKGRSSCLACNQRLFVALRRTCTHLKQPATNALMASLMGSEDLQREVGQRERQWDVGQRKGEEKRQEEESLWNIHHGLLYALLSAWYPTAEQG